MKILDEEVDGADESGAEQFIVRSVKSEVLRSLVFALQLEAESPAKNPDLYSQTEIDFYGEVRRFETNLIKQALLRTNGNQRAAAKLLRLNATTLNSKIKLYKIENFIRQAFN